MVHQDPTPTSTEAKNKEQDHLQRLNAVLRAIRKVNHIITQEKDRDRLLESCCQCLVETRGYHSAWIALTDETGRITLQAARSEGGGDAFMRLLAEKGLPACGRAALSQSQPGVQVFDHGMALCRNCSMPDRGEQTKVICARLESSGRCFGVLNVSSPTDLAIDAEETELFQEVVEDIAFALHSLDLQEQRRQAEAARQESEEQFTSLVERAHDGVFILQDENIKFANPAMCAMTGYTLQEMQELRIGIIHPEDREQIITHYRTRLQGGEAPSLYEARFQCRDGSCREVEISASLVQYRGRPASMGIIRDVTERRKAVEALRKSEDRFAKAFYSNPAGIVITTLEGRIQDVNETFLRMMGYQREEVLGRTTTELHIWPSPEMRHSYIAKMQEEHRIRDYEIELCTRDNRNLQFLISTDFIELEGEQCLLNMVQNVTEQRQAYAALRRSEDFYHSTVDALEEWIHVVDDQLRLRLINESFRRVARELEYSGDFIGQEIRDVFPFLPEAAFDEYRTVLETGKPLTSMEQNVIHDREYYTVTKKVPVLEGDRVVRVITVIRDVTEEKRAEEELRHREEQYRMLVENSPDVIYSLDAEGRIQFLNPTFERLTGWTSADYQGAHIEKFTHPEDLDLALQTTGQVSQGQIPAPYELRIPTRDGGYIVGEFTSIPQCREGRVIGEFGFARDITERKAAELALREEKERFRTLVDSLGEGVSIGDLEENLIFANPAAERLFGVGPGQLVGRNLKEFLSPEQYEIVRQHTASRVRGVRSHYEMEIIRADGERRTLIITATPLMSPEAGLKGVLGVFRDITDIKENQRQQQIILDINRILLGELDMERALKGLSQEMQRLVPHHFLILALIQKERDQVELVIVPSGDRQDLESYVQLPEDYFESYQGSLIQQIIYGKRNRIQTGIPVTGSKYERMLLQMEAQAYLATPLNNGGVPLGMLFLASENPAAFEPRHEGLLDQIQPQLSLFIQHQKLIERLLDSEGKYRSLFENSNDAMYILVDKRFVHINRRFEELLGYGLEEVNRSDFNFMNLVAPESRAMIMERTRRVAAGEKIPLNYEFKAISKSGNIIDFDVNVSYVNYDGQSATQGVLRDISERKRLEARQKEMELELMQQSKLSTMGMMAAGIAHNINVPLQGIINHIELLKMTRGDLPYLNDTLTQAQRIGAIINNMLYKSRQEQDQTERDIDLNQLLVEELNFLNADLVFKHRIEKDYRFDPRLPAIRGVYGDFSQALLNVIKNALDAMHDAPAKKLGVLTEVMSDGLILVEVRDSGCGIPQEHLDHIFDPFFSTKPATGKSQNGEPTGTGLGLSSSFQLLKKYQARFDVRSEPGKGTAFRIYLPVRAQEEANPTVPEPAVEAPVPEEALEPA
ncbi:MAG: PAS domain S-box protein [Candidatus Zixiibacteriota bacterium]|nr:MAG: PAS domain S-box protein [candidate division Zixibacteria bacterium]